MLCVHRLIVEKGAPPKIRRIAAVVTTGGQRFPPMIEAQNISNSISVSGEAAT